MAIGEHAATQCAILDFCEQGLFLRLNPSSAVALQKDKNAKIYFSASTGKSAKEFFQINAQVVRVTEDGIGVAFDNISESMYDALMKTAHTGPIAAYSKNPSVFLTSSSQAQFKDAFREMLNKKMPVLMRKFFDYAEDELEKTPEHVENFRDVAAQANLISILRMNKEPLGTGFCRAVTTDIDFTGDTDERKEGDTYGSNLSLVEKNVFEDWLDFSSVIKKINAQYKNQLSQLEVKLSYVTCFPRYLIKNPIRPEQLCNHFRNEIASIEESNAARRTLYKAFRNTLTDHLLSIYNAFDALLVDYGAPRDIAEDIVWKKNYPTNTKQNAFSNTSTSGQHLPSFDNDAYFYPESYNLSAPSALPPRAAYNQPVTQTASRLFSLMNQGLTATQAKTSGLAQMTGNETFNPFSNSEYSADELLAALAKLQASKAVQQLPQNASTLLQTQLDEHMDSSATLNPKAFSSADKTKLDIYDQFFQSLLNELALTPNIKSYLENIKLPLMALTLRDPDFLDSQTHPARNLLNQLSSLDSAVSENRVIKNTKIKQILDQLMSRIAQGSINNPDIFAKANDELKEISLPIGKSKELNTRRVIEIYEGKQKLEKARLKIQRAIDNRLAGKAVPSVIPLLLDSGWQHLLVITELNDNDNDNTTRLRYFEVVDELLAWYADLEQLPDEQYSIIAMELEFISNTLGTVCTNAFLHNKVIEELSTTLLGTGEPRIRKPVDSIFVERKATETETVKEFITDSWLLQVDQFETGDWFTFSLEKEAFEPLKLVWIGEIPPVYVFVNRDGYKKQEFTRNELAELLQSGAVTNIENLDEPLMDRATTTMLQHMQEKLIHSISHDPVTNLPNRKRFINLLKEQMADLKDSTHVLCYLEIEDFRIITNVCGLVGGDQLLLQVAQSLSNELGKDRVVSRLGDKTFGILLKNCSPDEGYETAKNIRGLINKANFVWDDKSYTISVSIGLVPVTEGTYSVEELLQKADSVNISAKRTGHNRIRIYQENDESLKTQTDIHEWAGRIDRIFSENRLFARCQMIAPIDTERNSHSHYEILLGVIDEVGKIIVPDKFIPAVERCQRMPEIDRWIVEHVFGWIMENRTCFDKIGGFAINLSGQSLNSEEFLTFLKDRLAMQDVPAEKITFEVTESVAAGSLAFTKRFIKEIKHFGCKFSLDDFGTGYSSYSYLKSLDVDYLKIDGSFIKDIANSPTDVVMVNSMNEIAHSLELETIAEYVENMKIHAILKEIGVDYAQGYGVHKPMPLVELVGSLMAQPDPSPRPDSTPTPIPDPNFDPDDPLADFFN